MKKIVISYALAILMLLNMTISVCATPVSESYKNNISVSGIVNEELEGTDVSILMYDNDESQKKDDRVLHVGMTKVNAGGYYQYKFKYTMPSGKTLNDYTLKAKIGNEDVSNTIVSVLDDSAKAIDVAVRMDAYNEPEVVITNRLENSKNAKLIVAGYTDGNRLTDTKLIDLNVGYDQKGEGYVVNIADVQGDYIKAFLWEDVLSVNPVAVFDKTQAHRLTKFKDGDRVAYAGDSCVHLSTTPAFIEHFYQTRYPDIDVEIYNAGIGGNTVPHVLGRLEWDVYYDNPNIVYMHSAGNDINVWLYKDANSGLDELKISKIYNCIESYKTFIDRMREDGKKIVVTGTTGYDDGDYGATSDEYPGCNLGIGVVNAKLEKMLEGEDYDDVENINMYRLSTQVVADVRKENPNASVFAGPDRVHLSTHGYLVEGAIILLSQGNDEIVSLVDIDVDNPDAKTVKNASVEVLDASSDKLTYVYAPGAIPLANNSWYRNAENIFPLTEKLNQEIIKVEGLSDGMYTVKFSDESGAEYNLGTYSNNVLETGLNIAINAQNPGQIQSIKAMDKQVSRYSKEMNVRDTAAKMRTEGTYTDELVLAELNAKKDAVRVICDEAKAISVPKTYTVSIEKQ